MGEREILGVIDRCGVDEEYAVSVFAVTERVDNGVLDAHAVMQPEGVRVRPAMVTEG